MKNLKIITLIFIIVLLITSVTYANSDKILIQVNDTQVNFNPETGLPYIDGNGIVKVPFIFTMRSLDADVFDYSNVNVLYARKDKEEIGLSLDESMQLRYNRIDIDDPNAKCALKDGIIYMPLEIVLNKFNYEYTKDNTNYTITIQKPPELIVKAPLDSMKDFIDIEIIISDDADLFINDKKVSKSKDNLYKVEVNKGYNIKAISKSSLFSSARVFVAKSYEGNFLETKCTMDDGYALISGKTGLNSKLTVNNSKVKVKSSHFEYYYKLKEGTNKIKIKSEDTKTHEIVNKTYTVSYTPIEDEDTSIYDNVEKTTGTNNSTTTDSSLKKPIIHLDKKISLKSDSTTIEVSGYCENATKLYILSQGGTRIKLDCDYDNRFTFNGEIKIYDKNGMGIPTSDGSKTNFQIVASNEDYHCEIEGFITYTGE